MKSMFNLIGLILVVAIVAYMAQKQMNLTSKLPAVEGSSSPAAAGTPAEQVQQVHQQLQQSVNSADQKLRSELDKQ